MKFTQRQSLVIVCGFGCKKGPHYVSEPALSII